MDELKREFYGISDVANYLGVSKEMIRKLIVNGELKASKIGMKYIVNKVDIEKYLERNKIN